MPARPVVQHGHFIVVGVEAVPICLEDPAHPDHPERSQFRSTQRSHTARAEHSHPSCQGEQDFLVPDSRPAFERPVDDRDDPRSGPKRSQDIPSESRVEARLLTAIVLLAVLPAVFLVFDPA
jgi:hypothetical protein